MTVRTALLAAALALAPAALTSAALAHGYGGNQNLGPGFGPGGGFHHIDGGWGGTIAGPFHRIDSGRGRGGGNPIFSRPLPLTGPGARPTAMP